MHEEALLERERELRRREISVLEREVRQHLAISNQPPPEKRKGKLNRIKVAKLGGIGDPTGWLNLAVVIICSFIELLYLWSGPLR